MLSASTAQATTTIVIVDPCPTDYQSWIDAGQTGQLEFCFAQSGEDALRVSMSSDAGLWLINSRLPDMSGIELHQLLRPHLAKVPVFLVADRYDPEAELAALQAGSLHFVCKPLTPQWLSRLVQSLRTHERRPAPRTTDRLPEVAPPIRLDAPSSYERARG